jgi:hypothetical protein
MERASRVRQGHEADQAAARRLRGREDGGECRHDLLVPVQRWNAQQFCNNGTLVQVLPCFGPF